MKLLSFYKSHLTWQQHILLREIREFSNRIIKEIHLLLHNILGNSESYLLYTAQRENVYYSVCL